MVCILTGTIYKEVIIRLSVMGIELRAAWEAPTLQSKRKKRKDKPVASMKEKRRG